ncbi:Uncharacterised protein [uncultured archaeon]|nr:Uncharacterised protein [uncultured archaeon]
MVTTNAILVHDTTYVRIPKAIAELMHINPGDRLTLKLDGRRTIKIICPDKRVRFEVKKVER